MRDVRYLKSSKTTHEVSSGITSLPANQAAPRRLLKLNRQHWAIENKLHCCRDVTFQEDRCRLAIGQTAHCVAILNNLVLGLLRVRGFHAIASAHRRFDALPSEALALVLNAFV